MTRAAHFKRRLEKENKKPQHLWVGAECIPVPADPNNKDDAPKQTTPDMNNPKQMENT